jgi:uncharacterized protein
MIMKVTKIFVNLPVKDLECSKAFFASLGFSFNEQFSDEKAACLVIGENLHAMLLTERFFSTFTKKPVSDATKHTEVLIAIDLESREEVDIVVRKAVEAGGKTYMDPQDHGWMYQHSFEDPDGHQWELVYMDEQKLAESNNGQVAEK